MFIIYELYELPSGGFCLIQMIFSTSSIIERKQKKKRKKKHSAKKKQKEKKKNWVKALNEIHYIFIGRLFLPLLLS